MQARHDDSKHIEVLPPPDKSKVAATPAKPKTTTTPASKLKVSAATDRAQADQPQADAPADPDPEEELTEDNLGELKDLTIDDEQITAESLKRTYHGASTGKL